jgi:hypothetical protein
MSDLQEYVAKRKKRDRKFAEGYEVGYEQFKLGVLLRQAREAAGLTQEELARRMNTQKSAISPYRELCGGHQAQHAGEIHAGHWQDPSPSSRLTVNAESA